VFHVSPFCPVRGRYRFVFMRTHGPTARRRARTVARIDYFDETAVPVQLLNTSVSGRLEPLTAATARRALWNHPAMTLGVIARIHWQALRLWIKRAPFFRQPPRRTEFVTPGAAHAGVRPPPPTLPAQPHEQHHRQPSPAGFALPRNALPPPAPRCNCCSACATAA
jgi:uncharacterized protein